MSSENRKGLWTTGHLALNWDGDAMVLACEEGHLDSVKALVEGHDVEKTGMSVDDMVNREGKIVVLLTHTFTNGSKRMSSWRSSSTSSRVVLQWTSLDRRISMVE